MIKHFMPLEPDTRTSELVYLSEAKLDQLLLSAEAPGGGVSFGGFGANLDTRKRSTRDLLESAAKMFQEQGLLTYDSTPEAGQWLLLRAFMECGTAWPWAGDSSPSRLTAWWVGSSETTRILAYGHRDHILGEGKRPSVANEDGKATWWPSRADASLYLLKEISTIVEADQLGGCDPWGTDETLSKHVEGLEGYFFSNTGVKRADPLVQRGVFEMMLRVDRTTVNSDGCTVLGSPLWVARERRSVPGIYTVTKPSEASNESIVGDWDGAAWRSFKVTTRPSDGKLHLGREPSIAYHSLEDLDFEPRDPKINEIVQLGESDWPQPRRPRPADPAKPSMWRRLFRSIDL